MKILTVVGARPQFIKAAVVSRALAGRSDLRECIVHTGQHYDERMSQVFFNDLAIPAPTHQLHVGSGTHGRQTGQMLAQLEEVLLQESPDWVLVYGDTNSTLAGALAAAKLHIPIAHVEAGLRSFNRRMPEEVNRVLTDHVSNLLLCPTPQAVENLRREGIAKGVNLIGDVMYDGARLFAEVAQSRFDPLPGLGLQKQQFALMTCHRAENTDDPRRLTQIVQAANDLGEQLAVVFPVHPRTQKQLTQLGTSLHRNVQVVEPISYLEMLLLEREAALILTDSGGVQKEAFFFGTPCVTMREETEWTETVETGANTLAGADCARIIAAARRQLTRRGLIPDAAPWYGEGRATQRIVELLQERVLA